MPVVRESACATGPDHRGADSAARPAVPGARARFAGPSPAQALALQRAAGNRAATRVLARWTKHPDEKQKGVMVPDRVAEDLLHFNPPQNK